MNTHTTRSGRNQRAASRAAGAHLSGKLGRILRNDVGHPCHCGPRMPCYQPPSVRWHSPPFAAPSQTRARECTRSADLTLASAARCCLPPALLLCDGRASRGSRAELRRAEAPGRLREAVVELLEAAGKLGVEARGKRESGEGRHRAPRHQCTQAQGASQHRPDYSPRWCLSRVLGEHGGARGHSAGQLAAH